MTTGVAVVTAALELVLFVTLLATLATGMTVAVLTTGVTEEVVASVADEVVTGADEVDSEELLELDWTTALF